MAGNGGRTRGKGFVQLTRAGRRSTPHSNTRRPSWWNTPFPGSLVTVPLNIRRHPPSAARFLFQRHRCHVNPFWNIQIGNA